MKNILDLLREDGFTPRRVGGQNGGEYHSPCPGCGGRDRFACWPESTGGLGGGRGWCRGGSSAGNGCDWQGDAVQYLRDFRGLSFRDAKEYLGVVDDWAGRQGRPRESRPAAPAWEPVVAAAPTELWAAKGLAFVEHCEQALPSVPEVLEWLAQRGISEDTARRCRLGFHTGCGGKPAFRPLSAWGLSAPRKPDGKEQRLVLLPGLVVPWFDPASGQLQKLKVREFPCAPWPEWAAGDKYREVKGSNQRYSIYGQGRDVAVVVETELDAILLAERLGDLAACGVATGSAQRRPDAAAATVLREARLILNALDGDDAGAKAAWTWWAQHMPNARRWPVPKRYGKDPGDLARAGVDVRLWAEAGISRHAPALLTRQPRAQAEQPRSVPAVAQVPAPGKVATAWAVPACALDAMQLPAGAPGLENILRALSAKPLGEPGCLVPCPRTRPPYWWTYEEGCAGCAGHPGCLLDLLRSEKFQAAVAGSGPATAREQKQETEV